jgi:hypothetical protein
MGMNGTSIDRETLVAYVDDELPAERAAEVEAELAKNSEAREMVRLMRLSAEAAAHAFDRVLEDPLPDRLLETLVSRAVVRRPVWSRIATRPVWASALAACLVGLVIGFSGSFLLHPGSGGYSPASAKIEDPLAASFQSALFGSLAQGQQGQSFDYGDDAIGKGHLVLGQRLMTDFGVACREFSREETRGTAVSRDNGLACQGKDGGWTVMVMPGQ